MRVLVCGGRDYDDAYRVDHELMALLNETALIEVVIHGGASGADTIADEWAEDRDIPVAIYPVSREEWTRLGKAAGPIRNARMLRVGKPDVVLAFPGGRGTADMVRQARRAGVRVIEVSR